MTFIYDEKTMNKIRSIEKYINWILNIQEVCELLSCSERTVYRMKKQFITLWPPWLIHGLKGKPSNHQGDNIKYADIRRIVKDNSKYHDFWPTLLAEHLEQDFWIKINKETSLSSPLIFLGSHTMIIIFRMVLSMTRSRITLTTRSIWTLTTALIPIFTIFSHSVFIG